MPRRNACLEHRQLAGGGEPFDGLDLGAVGLDREEQARADGDAVEPHGARTADAVLAADVRAGQAERVAEEVREEQPRLDLLAPGTSVDGDGRPRSCGLGDGVPPRAQDGRSARTPVTSRRYPALACIGPHGSTAARPPRPAARAARRRSRSRSGRARRAWGAPSPQPRQSRASVTRPRRRAAAQAAMASAKSPCAGPAPRTRTREPGCAAGQIVSTTSSSGSSAVVKCVTKNVLGRQLPALRREAVYHGAAERDQRERELGGASAWAIEPPTVPRLRVTKWPIERQALRDQRAESARAATPRARSGGRARRPGRTRCPRASRVERPRRGSRRPGARGAAKPHVQKRARGSGRRRAPSPRRRARRAGRPPPRRLSARARSRNGAGFTAQELPDAGRRQRQLDVRRRPSASATAFAIAAGTLIVLPSPSPFAPSGVNGDGVSRWPIRSGGRSGAVGQR